MLYNGLVYLTFQDEKSTARTLEEAMLNKLLKVDVFHAIKRSEWKEKRKINNLTFSIPNNKSSFQYFLSFSKRCVTFDVSSKRFMQFAAI